ncbi:MAG: GNAT family N-acetyltransferase, partial [Parvularculaceae bacterium]
MRMVEPPIRPATANDAGALATILAEAFAADPVMSWMLGGEGRAKELFAALTAHLYLARGFADIADEDAATLWLPAGAKAAPSFVEEARIALAVVRSGGLGALMRGKAVGDIMAKHHPAEPHFYLFAVGVRRAHQGRGLGGRIIRAGLARADAAGACAYLENSNPRNAPLYRSLGFLDRAPLPLPAGAPPLL